MACILEAESNGKLFKWLDDANVNYSKGQTKISHNLLQEDFIKVRKIQKLKDTGFRPSGEIY